MPDHDVTMPELPGYKYDTSLGDSDLSDDAQVIAPRKEVPLTQLDTVTQHNIAESQSFRTTGEGSHDTVDGEVISNNPAQPAILLPNLTDDAVLSIFTKVVQSPNSWFDPSFGPSLQTILDEVLAAQRKNRFLESKVEMRSRESLMETAKSTAKLTEASYDLQAEQYLVEAVTSFTTAGIGAMSLIATSFATKRANNDPRVQQAEARLKPEQQKLDDLQQQKDLFVGDKIEEGKLQKQIDAQQGVVNKLASEKEVTFNSVYNHKITEIQATEKVLTGAIEGASKFTVRSLTQERGSIEKVIKELEGYTQMLRTFTENSGKYRDDAAAAYNEAIRLIRELVHSIFQSHSLKA